MLHIIDSNEYNFWYSSGGDHYYYLKEQLQSLSKMDCIIFCRLILMITNNTIQLYC